MFSDKLAIYKHYYQKISVKKVYLFIDLLNKAESMEKYLNKAD